MISRRDVYNRADELEAINSVAIGCTHEKGLFELKDRFYTNKTCYLDATLPRLSAEAVN